MRDPSRPSPNLVMETRIRAGTTSPGVSAYFLCGHCERRFSQNGERYVSGQYARGDRFPLFEKDSLFEGLKTVAREALGNPKTLRRST